jgi:hypothetical protein
MWSGRHAEGECLRLLARPARWQTRKCAWRRRRPEGAGTETSSPGPAATWLACLAVAHASFSEAHL